MQHQHSSNSLETTVAQVPVYVNSGTRKMIVVIRNIDIITIM